MLQSFLRLVGLAPSHVRPEDQHPILGPAASAARLGDASHCGAIFVERRHDPNLRFAAIEVLVDNFAPSHLPKEAALDHWVTTAPNDVFARLTRSWYQRGKIPTYSPSDPNRGPIIAEGDRRRAIAKSDLAVARQLAPDDAVVAAFEYGALRSDEAADHRLYDPIAAAVPTIRIVHDKRFWSHTERWGGAFDDALEFARYLGRSHPATELPLFVLYAHWERVDYLRFMAERPDEAKSVLRNLKVRAECAAAYEATLGSPTHVATVDTWWYRQLAARWFYMSFLENLDQTDRRRAQTEVDRLGDVYRESPFVWGGPKGFREFRALVKG